MAAPITFKMQNQLNKLKLLKKMSTYRFISTVRMSIKDALAQSSSNKKLPVLTEGWIKSLRKQKKNTFFHLNDGTSSSSVQVVADSQLCESCLSVGCSVRIEGDLVASPAQGQAFEIQATKVQVTGECNNDEYPLKPKTSHSLEFLRQHLHLRPRSEHHAQVLRLRNAASMAVHKYFQEQGYIFIHTPILSSNDCEGAGETFNVQTDVSTLTSSTDKDFSSLNEDSTKNDDANSRLFFGHPAYLTVSGQLHLEAISGAFRKAYNFGPTFRAENSVGKHHLAEFYMIEAEIAFTQTLEDIMKEMESLVKSVGSCLLNDHEEALQYFWNSSGISDQVTVARNLLDKDYIRMTYTDAIKLLEKKNEEFVFKVKWGCDLQKEHEKYLVRHCDNIPVFITDFPTSLKPFYARQNENKDTVAATDLLVPEVGELFGGSLREERYDVIKSRLDELNLTQVYQWYLDLRRYGSVPHGGFGMGFERFLQCFLGINNIRDTIPFPRWSNNCSL